MVDSVRDAEASRVFPHMLSVLLDILRNTEPSMKKDTLEYQFRRVLVEIINRIPASEALRPHANKLAMTMLHILRTDTEDNAVTCVKTIVDMVRSLKVLTDEHVASFLKYFQELLGSVPELVNTYLCEGSPVLNPNDPFPGTKSFKVLIEAPIAVVLFSQAHRQIATPIITEIVPLATDVSRLVFPTYNTTRYSSYHRSY
jgi:transformation/transcription domain-associated protein